MASTTQDGPDTALARVLHAQGALPLPTLQTLLERVRAQRLHDPHASLEALLRANHTLPPHTLQRALDSLAPPPPTLGPYVLERELARGGMGAVHLALDPHTGAHLALKTLPRELAQDPDLLLRFQAEAQLAAQLDHPHIARVHAADFSADPPYLVQELLTGGSLQDRLQHGPLPVDEAVRVVSQLCDAVAHAHQHGVIHRDLKPDNVLFDEHGQAKLVDFGLARQLADAQRLTHTGQLLGTPNYMAPEQAEGRKDTDERADVYGLGGILYACLTGRPPFTGSSVFALLEKVLREPPVPPSQLNSQVPGWLDRAVGVALAKSPAQRPPSAQAWSDMLTNPTPPAPRRPWTLASTGLAVIVLGAVAYQGTRPPQPTTERELEPEPDLSPADDPLQVARAALLREDVPAALRALEGVETSDARHLRGCALLWSEDLDRAQALLPAHLLAVRLEQNRCSLVAEQRVRLQQVSATQSWDSTDEVVRLLHACEALVREGSLVRDCVGEELWPQFRERLHTPGLLELMALRGPFFRPDQPGVKPDEARAFAALLDAYARRHDEAASPTSAMALGLEARAQLEGGDAAEQASWLERWPDPSAFRHPALRNVALLGVALARPDAPIDPWGVVDMQPRSRDLLLELSWLVAYGQRHAADAFARYRHAPDRAERWRAFAEATLWYQALVEVQRRRHWQPKVKAVLQAALDRAWVWAHAPAPDPLSSLLPPHVAHHVDPCALYLSALEPESQVDHLDQAAHVLRTWWALHRGRHVDLGDDHEAALNHLDTFATGADRRDAQRWREAGLRLRLGWAARTGRWWIALRDSARLNHTESALLWQRGDPWDELLQPGPSGWTTW